MNPRRNRPNSSVYWSHSTATRPNAKRSQSTVNVHQNEHKYDSKLRLYSSKSAASKNPIEKSKSQVSLAEFRLLHRQSRPCSLLRSRSLHADKSDKKYLIKGAGLLKTVEQAAARVMNPDEQKNQCSSQPVNIEDETEINENTGPPFEFKRKKSKLQNFPYADLNPNYLIDQYYYTRKALNKSQVPGCSKNDDRNRVDEDRRKLKLANHVIKEMKKLADQGPNKNYTKDGKQPVKAQLFFKDYYTDTTDMGTQFTRERKVKIWLNNCNFQCRTSRRDISNAWTNMI